MLNKPLSHPDSCPTDGVHLIPYKKPKGGKLTEEEKAYNRGLSSFRVAVEHRIGRTKRFRIVAERFRNPLRTHHAKTSIVAGLVNIEAGFWP